MESEILTSINDIPYDIIYHILHQDILDIKSITNANLINRQFNKVIKDNFESIIYIKFQLHHDFINLLKNKNLSLIKSDLNIDKLVNLLNNFEYVSKMKKRQKYQHLLIYSYNSSIFNIKYHQDPEEQEYFESVTLGILMTMLDYVKNNYDITKTNISPWALYCLLDYIATIINTKTRLINTIFLKNDIYNTMLNRLYSISSELKKTKKCNNNIKIKLKKTIQYLSKLYYKLIKN
jgi:hypothetical protein